MNNMIFGTLVAITCSSLDLQVVGQQAVNIPDGAKATVERKAAGVDVYRWIVHQDQRKYTAVLFDGTAIEMDADGNWLKSAKLVSKKKLPEPAKTTLAAYRKDGYTVGKLFVVEDVLHGTSFVAHLSSAPEQFKLVFDANGKVLALEKRDV